MSRIGRRTIAIPSQVTVSQQGPTVAMEGPKGKAVVTVPQELSVSLKDNCLQVQRANDLKPVKALHGLYRALLANSIQGVSEGFRKELEVVGVGYRAEVKGKQLNLYVGFSHTVQLPIPEGITIETPKPTMIIVKGADRQLVGQIAANIKRIAPPEPYKGKGIRYVGQSIRRKAGKAATGAKGGKTAA